MGLVVKNGAHFDAVHDQEKVVLVFIMGSEQHLSWGTNMAALEGRELKMTAW